MNNFILNGKVNLLIDGQFGSTGKGLIASKIASENHIDFCVASLSPNAGHTFYYEDEKYVTKLLPVAAKFNDRSTVYITADSVLDIDILLKEIEEFGLNEDRLIIHPRAAIIDESIKQQERESLSSIASTQSGTGYARANKVMRKAKLACDIGALKHFAKKELDVNFYLNQGCSFFVESGQGIGLGLNHGYSYPYCTSRDVLPASLLGDLGAHPKYCGNIMLSLRTFPIRVGNIIEDEKEIGYSGPFYNDSNELTWEELKQIPELTTVTKRVRRVATFSEKQLKDVLLLVEPTYIFLNFINYLKEEDINFFNTLFLKMNNVFVGYGPHFQEISKLDKHTLENFIFKSK